MHFLIAVLVSFVLQTRRFIVFSRAVKISDHVLDHGLMERATDMYNDRYKANQLETANSYAQLGQLEQLET